MRLGAKLFTIWARSRSKASCRFVPRSMNNFGPSIRARYDHYPRSISRPDRGTPIGLTHTVPTGLVGLFKSGADLVKRMNARALCEHRSADPDVVAGGLERVVSGERFGSVDSGSS